MTNHGPREQRTVPTGPAFGVCLVLAVSLIAATVLTLSSWPIAAGARLTGAASTPLGKGVLLVASPSLLDPNFRQTVILICDHGSAGTLGLVLNRPTNLLLSEALSDVPSLQGTAHLLFAGGPVQPGNDRGAGEGGGLVEREPVLVNPDDLDLGGGAGGRLGWRGGIFPEARGSSIQIFLMSAAHAWR